MEDERRTQLVQRLRRGEPRAFDEVYAAEKDRIYGFLLRLSRDPSTAADLFQNVWLKLARNAADLREDSNVAAWLFTVARREYIAFRRAQALDLSRMLLVGSVRSDMARTDPDADLALQRALTRLSDADREVLMLSVSGMDSEEIAAVIGISAVALRQRLARARRRLSELLDAEDDLGEPAITRGARQ